MLILTRRIQEALLIGDEVSVVVLSVKGNQVRLGIDAPDHVEVHREEIYHRAKSKPPLEPMPYPRTPIERDISYSMDSGTANEKVKRPTIKVKKKIALEKD